MKRFRRRCRGLARVRNQAEFDSWKPLGFIREEFGILWQESCQAQLTLQRSYAYCNEMPHARLFYKLWNLIVAPLEQIPSFNHILLCGATYSKCLN